MKSKYSFSNENKITVTLVDSYYVWLGFLGASNVCALHKASVFNPNQSYWEVDITADEIKFMQQDSTYLYLAIDDSTNSGAKVTKSNPSTITYFTKQAGITEASVDLCLDATYVYFLTPGVASGINSKIVKYNKSTRAYVETIDLTTVNNAKKIDIDTDGSLWITSETDPVKLTKAIYSGSWSFTTYTLS